MRISDWSSDVCSSDLLIVEGQAPVAAEHLRPRLGGALIVAGGSTRYSAEAILAAGNADLVAFGRHFIASPGLPERFRRSLPLDAYDRSTFYGGDARGYTDYPAYDLPAAE